VEQESLGHALYIDTGRSSVPPERLLRALLLQAFYTIRSERQLMEQLDYSLLYRWFLDRARVGADGIHEEPRAAARCGGGEEVPG